MIECSIYYLPLQKNRMYGTSSSGIFVLPRLWQ